MRDLSMDIRYGARTLAKRPVLTATVIAVLALGIGPNVAIFTFLDTLLLRPLPYADPDRLVELTDVYEGQSSGVGQSEYRDWSRNASVFEGLALSELNDAVVSGDSQVVTDRIQGARVTAGFFDVLGAAPLLGRTFLPDEDLPGRAEIIVLGHGLWQRRFGGRPDIVGETLWLDHDPHTVVGVMPADFFWVGSRDVEFFRPLGYLSSGRGQHQYAAVGRLKPGVSLVAARSQMEILARRAEEQYPEAKGWSVLVQPLGAAEAQKSRPPLLVLAVAVGLVQLLACANIGGLMLVRVMSRSSEIAVRTALGARPTRLARELLVECGLLGVAGAGPGLLLAPWLLLTVAMSVPPSMGLPSEIAIDGRGLAFSLLLLIVTTFLFALAPAQWTLSRNSVHGLKTGGAPAPRRGFLGGVIVVEVGLATTLLVAAGLLIMSLNWLFSEDLGFRHENLLTMEVSPPEARLPPAQRVEFYGSLLDLLGELPGVESAAATSALPMSSVHSGTGFEIEGRPTPDEWRLQSSQWCVVTPGYFRTMGIPLLQGRDVLPSDSAAGEGVAVISESMARLHWPADDPVGQRIRTSSSEPWLRIVGVVSDTRYGGPTLQANPTMYVPYEQAASSWPWEMFVAVRFETMPEPVIASMRRALPRLHAEMPLTRLVLMDELIADTLVAERAVTSALVGFALLAVVLSAVGLYGVVAQSVALRTRELGLRLALGATHQQLLRMVLRRALVLTGAGAAWGMLLAFATTRGLETLLYGVDPLDLRIFAAVPLLLVIVALLASYFPARRAASIDPVAALRAS